MEVSAFGGVRLEERFARGWMPIRWMRDDRFAWMKDERGQRAALSAALGLRFEAGGVTDGRGKTASLGRWTMERPEIRGRRSDVGDQKSEVGRLVIYLAACELYIQEILLLLGYTRFFPLNSFM